MAYAIANLPTALNPFANWGNEIDDLLDQLMAMYDLINKMGKPIITPIVPPTNVLSPGQQIPFQFGVDPSQIGPGGTIIGPQLNPLPISFGLSRSGQDFAQLSSEVASMFTGFGQSSTNVNYVYNINGATPSLMDEIRSGLVDSSASGSFSSVGRVRNYN